MMENLSALVVDSRNCPTEKVRNILTAAGWEVVVITNDQEAVNKLSETQTPPFSILISGSEPAPMGLETLFKLASEFSPLTQKLLLIPAQEKELLIHMINKTDVQACMCFPFSGQDLVQRANDCHQTFLQRKEKQWFQQLVQRQNDQLYKAAQNFKKKEALNRRKLDRQIKRLSSLASRLPVSPADCDRYFDSGDQALKTLFRKLADGFCPDWDPDSLTMSYIPGTETPAAVSPAVDFALANLVEQGLGEAIKEKPAHPQLNFTSEESKDLFSTYLELILSDDHITAWLEKKTPTLPKWITAAVVMNYLIENEIFFGSISHDNIADWLKGPEKKLAVAEGKPPDPGQKGSVKYHFDIDYQNAGRILPDGTIDFKDRGKVPYVEKGDLLAVKTPPETGNSGMTVYGFTIPPAIPSDQNIFAGTGTTFSKDALKVYADETGRPFVDSKGTVTVSKDLIINGDVNYGTGNINFKGHIVVKGIVRPGFSVKGIHLTALALEGATVELTGDIKVKKGIVDSTVISAANLNAGYVNKSRISAFETVRVEKEILDSKILTSGRVDNQSGHIIGSRVSAKQGIQTKKAGTLSSLTHLKIGVNDHTDKLVKVLENKIAKCKEDILPLREQITTLRKKDTRLHRLIADTTQIQKTAINELKACKVHLESLNFETDAFAAQQAAQRIKRLKKKWTDAETEIKNTIRAQDEIHVLFEQVNEQLVDHEENAMRYFDEKRFFEKYSATVTPLARLEIGHKIFQTTKIFGPKSHLELQEDKGRCIIQEKPFLTNGVHGFAMEIS